MCRGYAYVPVSAVPGGYAPAAVWCPEGVTGHSMASNPTSGQPGPSHCARGPRSTRCSAGSPSTTVQVCSEPGTTFFDGLVFRNFYPGAPLIPSWMHQALAQATVYSFLLGRSPPNTVPCTTNYPRVISKLFGVQDTSEYRNYTDTTNKRLLRDIRRVYRHR